MGYRVLVAWSLSEAALKQQHKCVLLPQVGTHPDMTLDVASK